MVELKVFYKLILLVVLCTACSSKKVIRDEFPTEPAIIDTTIDSQNLKVGNQKESNSESTDPVIRSGYLIEIVNLEDQKLNDKFRVEFNGDLRLPYNVTIKASGIRLSELKRRLEQAYSRYFQTASAFSVRLDRKDLYIDIRGLVEKPGRQIVDPDASIDSIISEAGGLKKDPEPRYLRILRADKEQIVLSVSDYLRAGSLFSTLKVMAGDTFFFQADKPAGDNIQIMKLPEVEIIGEVENPGKYTFKQDSDLYAYLSEAGGPKAGAYLSQIKIIRGPENEKKIETIDLLEEGKKPVIKPGDIILVPFDKPTKLERNVTVGAGLATILSAIILILAVL